MHDTPSPKAGRRKRNAERRNLFGNQGEVADELFFGEV
jgi:hypothetical protein